MQIPKHTFIIILFFSLSNSLFSQNKRTRLHSSVQTINLKNEIKLNLAYIPLRYVEATYERILPESSSSLGIVFGRSLRNIFGLEYHGIVYYRLFFGQLSGTGFFIEANATSWKENRTNLTGASVGAGFAAGYKLYIGTKLCGEIVMGAGNTIIDNSADYDEVYPRFGILLGYRL